MRHRLAILAAGLSLAAAFSAVPRPASAQAPATPLVPDTPWVPRSAIYEVNVRDFSATGDLKGVTAGLDRVAAAGANVLWLMPIYPVGIVDRKGTLGSPYAVRDYDAIDSAFGTPADLHALVAAAHARDMQVILDWVPDHTAPDNPWVHEHPDFYYHDARGQPAVPHDLQGNPTDWTDVRQLDYHNPAMRTAMIAAMRHWLVTYDLDGFRQDVAHFIPLDFWREANTALRAAAGRPILLLAEAGGLEPVVLLNKADLECPPEANERLEHYSRMGYRVLRCSAKSSAGIVGLAAALRGRTAVFSCCISKRPTRRAPWDVRTSSARRLSESMSLSSVPC